MPVFRLTRRLVFPPAERADPDGLLAVGGDLSVSRLLLAYRSGIFPWYEEGMPILWYSPDPRMVLRPDALHVSHSLRRTIGSGRFDVTFDTDFAGVIHRCRTISRPGQRGTWITADMQEAYGRLHAAGQAHSVEVRRAGRLVGGLYGVAVGACFCGESMFADERDASKVALAALVTRLRAGDFALIDCQVPTEHLARLGAVTMPRTQFLPLLATLAGKNSRF
jgi:leucyl/phenylalanyl-tRNA--protein transferase